MSFFYSLLLPVLIVHIGAAPTCEDGWSYWEMSGLCYRAELIELGNYTTRIDHCTNYGAVLASAHNGFDNYFLRQVNASLSEHSLEFGLVYADSTGWVFLDGTNATYFNWDQYQDPPQGVMAAGIAPDMTWWSDPQYDLWGGAPVCQKKPISN